MNLISLMLVLSTVWSAEGRQIPVPKPFTVCKKDVDCDITTKVCGCCEFIAMNKKFVAKYGALAKYCKEPPPPCDCSEPPLVPKCVKKICRLVRKN